ncbi:sugar efflux transporter [Serratia rhizosphaerae]|uniref:MFS transporter n=1 Tax=Serratia rhizosphaerae TaxID=2597702 RepID=A0ABX6GSV9_9GAMM|nr:sugar efflux transporter [Serratia rhizosphaerae]MEB6336114.1 sugar efflux transporter [Serratia rhizosphaerae]QHA89373.1 MFS transporter [Serratia rhizosphaerae]
MELERDTVSQGQGVNIVFMAVALILGMAGALQMPVVSLFLTREIGASPFMVGMFYTVNALAGVGVSQLMARKSDAGGNRRRLILLCCSVAIANALLFAFSRDYRILVSAGVILSALATTAMPQLFALARQYSVGADFDVIKFTTRMRAQISISWVIAPPVAFFIIAHFGFTALYLLVALLFVLGGLFVLSSLPAGDVQPRSATPATSATPTAAGRSQEAWLLFAALALLWGGDTMYLIDMPIYISSLPGMGSSFAGWLLGGAAGLEILIMLFCSPVIKRVGTRPMMLLAAGCSALFYLGMTQAVSPWALAAIQVLNAVFIGIVGALGMLYLQELMPDSPGTASTLYSNSIATGAIFAGLLQGAISQHWNHQAVYYAALSLSLLALLLLLKVKDA